MKFRTYQESMDAMRYRGPEIEQGDVRLNAFEVTGQTLEDLRCMMQGRGCVPGTYHKLIVDDTLWMSDTTAECEDHLMAVWASDNYPGGTGLINGLGMGCVLGAWLDVLNHVDVVEQDERIIDTIGAWYKDKYGDQVTIHHGDAYTIKWPVGKIWSVAWHDIWPSITDENLPGMARLHRRYGHRVDWQGSWLHDRCLRMRETGW